MRAAACALLILGASAASAQQPAGGGVTLPGIGVRSPHPESIVHGSPGFHGFFPGFIIQREYVPVIEREIIREVPAAAPAPAAPPPPPRKAYVLGRSYSSLPGGCMKLIQDGGSYYYCSGEWYREVGAGSAAQYKAVAQP